MDTRTVVTLAICLTGIQLTRACSESPTTPIEPPPPTTPSPSPPTSSSSSSLPSSSTEEITTERKPQTTSSSSSSSQPPPTTTTTTKTQAKEAARTMKSCRGTRECMVQSFKRGTGFCLCNATHHPDDDCLIDEFALRLQPLEKEEEEEEEEGGGGNGGVVEGVVEVFMDGVWGQLCDDYWDIQDAKVVCRHLGLPSTNVKMWARTNFTEPRQLYLFSLRCQGTERHLRQCPFRYGVGCCGSGFGRFEPVVSCQ